MRLWFAVMLVIAAGAKAADPGVDRSVATPAPAARPPTAASTPPKPLDLRIGDIRRYITPDEYRALLGAPAQDANTVVVQANAPLLPMKLEEPVPGGLASLWYAAKNPTQIWRILVPDPKQGPIGPPQDPVPPPVFRWGP